VRRRRAARDVDEVADAAGDRLVAEQEVALPFDDVERLVLVAVDVRGRAAAGRHERLHREVRAAGLGAGHEEAVAVAGAEVRGAAGGRPVQHLAEGRRERHGCSLGSGSEDLPRRPRSRHQGIP
jgi:hypothetical protein